VVPFLDTPASPIRLTILNEPVIPNQRAASFPTQYPGLKTGAET
jgi:hypothetical protein